MWNILRSPAAIVISGTMLAACLAAQDQRTVYVGRTSDWSDSRRDGQCLIRVIVDNQAEVELRWDQVLVRTLAGRPSRDAGSQCNAPLPQGGVTDFQFQAVDGRGNVQLLQQPNAGNGWAAVARIQDSDGGEDTYSYRVSWTWDGVNYQNQNPNSGRQRPLGRRNNARTAAQVERTCRNAVADRILQEWSARVVNYGRRIDRNDRNNDAWSYAGTTNIQGRAQISNGSERREIEFTCVMNVNDQAVQQLTYNFIDTPFNATPNRSGITDQPNGMTNVISACQNEIRNRVSEKHATGRLDFRDESRKWWEGNEQRVSGRAFVRAARGNATIEYNCRASGDRIAWADFRVLSGSLPVSNYR
jgi:hypothetical protein